MRDVTKHLALNSLSMLVVLPKSIRNPPACCRRMIPVGIHLTHAEIVDTVVHLAQNDRRMSSSVSMTSPQSPSPAPCSLILASVIRHLKIFTWNIDLDKLNVTYEINTGNRHPHIYVGHNAQEINHSV